MKISFDFSKMQEEQALVSRHKEQMQRVHHKISEQKAKQELGFTKLPYQDKELDPIFELAKQIKQEFANLVVIGIGGSDLGTRAVHRALNHQFYNQTTEGVKLYFIGDTTDPVALSEVLDIVSANDTCFTVVSKSGNTIEQMSTFVYVRDWLIKELGEEEHTRHIVILTDPETGTLREIVKRQGYRSLPIPPEVGGRFSVLSSTSLFPLAVVGIDIKALLQGAKDLDEFDNSADINDNPALNYALLQYIAYLEGKPISVFMPYTYSLREVGFWFRQLWAESLGKKKSLDDHDINVGPTPIASLGPTDQHSQVQLYMEGPSGKVFTFVTVASPRVNMVLPEAFSDMEGVAYLKGHDFNEILLAEQKATAHSLYEVGRPSSTITLPHLDAYTLGQLLYFFELATTYAGAFYHINTFDQPGVEIGKKYMYGLMGRAGFEDFRI